MSDFQILKNVPVCNKMCINWIYTPIHSFETVSDGDSAIAVSDETFKLSELKICQLIKEDNLCE